MEQLIRLIRSNKCLNCKFPFIGIYAIRNFFKRLIHFAPNNNNSSTEKNGGTATKIWYIIYISFTIYHVFTHEKQLEFVTIPKSTRFYIYWADFRLHYSVHIFRTLVSSFLRSAVFLASYLFLVLLFFSNHFSVPLSFFHVYCICLHNSLWVTLFISFYLPVFPPEFFFTRVYLFACP